jgi:hypothetical protein
VLPEHRLSDEDWFDRNGHWVGATIGASSLGAELNAEEFDDFRLVVAPVESRSGRPLGGVGLRKCLRAFKERPSGFRRCAADALERGSRNPVGLLITMVDQGDHLRTIAA